MKLKTRCEDFIVEERFSLPSLKQSSAPKGSFAYFLLEKKDWNTQDVIGQLAHYLHVSLKAIGYAGNKDKHAWTKQHISLKISSPTLLEKAKKFVLPNVTLTYLGWNEERITLGDLIGNHFVLVVRDVEKTTLSPDNIKNLYGEQRFGIEQNNVAIGKALVQHNFQESCMLLDLAVEENNYVGALRTLDLRILRLYVAAYQSWLWNAVALQIDTCEDNKLPIVGFLTTFKNTTVEQAYNKLLANDGVNVEDFLINSFKEISHEGGYRDLYVSVQNFSCQWSKDALHPGKLQCTLIFDLPKGCYATVVANALFPP